MSQKVLPGVLHGTCRSWGFLMLLLSFLSEVKGNGNQTEAKTTWWGMADLEDFKICSCSSCNCTKALSIPEKSSWCFLRVQIKNVLSSPIPTEI